MQLNVDRHCDAVCFGCALQARAERPGGGGIKALELQPLLLQGDALKIWRAAIARGAPTGEPGSVLETAGGAITIACGDASALKVTELQRAGGKRLAAGAFLAGSPIRPGERLGT